eukprot:169217-Rhodomonas_salina.2
MPGSSIRYVSTGYRIAYYQACGICIRVAETRSEVLLEQIAATGCWLTWGDDEGLVDERVDPARLVDVQRTCIPESEAKFHKNKIKMFGVLRTFSLLGRKARTSAR